jgi:predicted deacylase
VSALSPIQKLGRNAGGYQGDTIDIQKVLREIQAEALQSGWRQDCFLNSDEFCLLAYHRQTGAPHKRVYISAGIHGDEPAGPLAVRELVLQRQWPDGIDVWLCPCLNPTGFPAGRRENIRGFDLNRQYLHLEAAETKAHVLWLDQQPNFDVVLCLHEDWEAIGFYLYELNPDQQPSFAEEMIRRVSEVCPIDRSPMIEGRAAHEGIIRPSADARSRPQWPEAYYLLTHKSRLTYTLEAPSDYPMPARVAALVMGVRTVLDLIHK